MTPATLIDQWLARRAAPGQIEWLGGVISQAARGALGPVALGFSQMPRRLGSGPLQLSEAEISQASEAKPGWKPGRWTLDELGRARLVLELGGLDANTYQSLLSSLFDDADWAEQVALYKALPILARPETLIARGAEGIRSNIKPVFEAVALDNPFPAEHFAEAQFNQLVLKCLFVESPLLRVHGLDQRLNPTLARMLCDYARERWAAGRKVSPELWRGVGPVANAEMLELMQRPLLHGEPRERLGAALSLLDNEIAKPLIEEHAPWIRRLTQAGLSWSGVLDWQGPIE